MYKGPNIQNTISANKLKLANSVKTTNDTLKQVAHQVNSKITNVNIQNDTIYKMDEIQTMQTNELNDQLRELERIQNILATKDRLIDETNKNTDTYHSGFQLLIGFISLSILLVIPWIGYLTKNISYSIFVTIVISFFIIYAIYVAWKFNLLYLQTLFNKKSYEKGLGRDLAAFEHSAYMEGQKLAKDAREDLYGKKSTWIKNHCVCPVEEEGGEEQIIPEGDMGEESMLKGYFYYDGTAPKQLLVPPPIKNNAGLYHDQIEWPDYSKSIQNKPGNHMRQEQHLFEEDYQPNDNLVGIRTWTANI